MRALGTAAALLVVALLGGVAFAEPPGDSARGRELFTAKNCARCHLPGGQRGMGPRLEELQRPQGAYELAGRLWNHAPAMFTLLKQEGLEWPRIEEAEMADLMAYLGADPGRDPAPDLLRGQITLVGKGCLKCHRFKREGARIGPDLAERRDVLAPAARFAARMWSHTPQMAAISIQRGLLYPRFAGDEMVHLIGFLRGPGTP